MSQGKSGGALSAGAAEERPAGAKATEAAGLATSGEVSSSRAQSLRGASRRVDMTRGPIVERLIALAWPLFVGNILNTFYNLADMYWVSLVGTDEVAAVAITFPTVWLTFSLGMGVTIAGVAFVAQYTGAGKNDEAAHVAGQVVLLATAAGVLLALVAIAFRDAIAAWMGAQGRVLELASTYLLITSAGLPFKYIYYAYRSVSQGTGDSKTPRNLLLLTTMTNVVLDPFFVLGWAGLPAMGVAGAAWATLIAEGIGAAVSLLYLMNGRLVGVRLRFSHLAPDWGLIHKIAELGLAGSLDMGSRGLSSVAVAAIVSRFGTVEAAAYGIVNRLMSVVWTSSGAMEQAAASGVGQNLGAGQIERASRLAWTGAAVMFSFLTAVAALLYLFADAIVGVFGVSDQVVATAVRFLRLHVFSYGFWGAFEVLLGAFRGAGQTLPPAIVTFANRWGFQVPVALFASYSLGLGPDGYWVTLLVGNVLFFIVTAVWFRLGRWKRSLIA